MNNTIIRFFQKHNINEKMLAIQSDSHIWSTTEIDSIVSKYGLDGEEQNGNISVADIIGYDACGIHSSNLIYDLSNFFDEKGDGYHSRSCGLLDISSDEIMQVLERSFQTEPVVVHHIHGNNNMIYTNGLHRYAVLRTHFLNESYGLSKDSEEYQALRQKYTFPAKIKPVDLVKTYSNFLLSINPNLKVTVRIKYDEKWQPTNNVEITLNNGEKQVLNNEQLIEFTREVILAAITDSYTMGVIERTQERNEKFAEYITTYFPELSIKQKKDAIGGAQL